MKGGDQKKGDAGRKDSFEGPGGWGPGLIFRKGKNVGEKRRMAKKKQKSVPAGKRNAKKKRKRRTGKRKGETTKERKDTRRGEKHWVPRKGGKPLHGKKTDGHGANRRKREDGKRDKSREKGKGTHRPLI